MRGVNKASIVFIGLLLTFLPFLEHGSLVWGNSKNQESDLITLVNKKRTSLGILEVKESSLLSESAQRKAEDMVERGYFSHICSEGVTPWHWFDEVGYDYRFAGENLGVNFQTNEKLFNSWMNSSAHRKNILSENYSEIGIGFAQGYYKGKSVLFVVQHFGTPQVDSTIKKSRRERKVKDELGSLLKKIGELKFLLTS